MCNDVGVAFWPPVTTASCRKNDCLVLHFQVHGGIAEREELMAWLYAGETWLLSGLHPAEEALHGFVQPVIDLCQELAVDSAQFRVVLLALAQGLLGTLEVPAFPAPQAHHPPVVQSPAFGLHELQGFGVLVVDFDFDLLTE